MADYWLADWLNEKAVWGPGDLRRLLKDTKSFDRAWEIAQAAAEADRQPRGREALPTVVAGRQLDLSGITACTAAKCLKRELDEGLAPVWQYFDQVIVEGLASERFLAARASVAQTTQLLEVHSAIYMHAEKIGALPYMKFRTKPSAFCATHYREHAREVGVPVAPEGKVANSIVNKLAAEGEFRTYLVPSGEEIFMFSHPLFATATVLTRAKNNKGPEVTAQYMARRMYSTACIATIGDVALSREMMCPLVTNSDTAIPFARKPTSAPRVEDVALSLTLPVLEGGTTEHILRLREEHSPHYEKFRAALTVAIRETIHRMGDDDPSAIADAVRKEYVVPALADIEVKLATAARAYSLKAGATLAVGGALVVVGLLSGIPLILGSGVAASAGGASVPLQKYTDDRREVKLSDMYFLWQASKKIERHRRR